MKKYLIFLVLTFGSGLVFQSLFFYIVPSTVPSPQWFLLGVLALGAQGRTKTATTLGFFWGLAQDAFGVTAFGTQGWLFALAGYGAGTVSKYLNADKWGAQETLTITATLAVAVGVQVLSALFVDAPVGSPGWGVVAVQTLLNGLVAPAVFWVFSRWADLWVLPVKNA